jgi:hypothetical protein
MSAEVMRHVELRGADTRIGPELRPDLERIVRRARIAQRQGLPVELSPYMKSLMRLEEVDCDNQLNNGSPIVRVFSGE